MTMSARFAALRWRIIRNGPNDERGFGLIVGLVAAAGVLALAVLGLTGVLHPSWLILGVSLFGATWLIGPLLLPGLSPILDPQWFRTLPRNPSRVAREMTASEAISVGTLITALALGSMVILAVAHGPAAMIVALVAVLAQLFFLLWLGRCAAALVAGLLRSGIGTWIAAFQMSALLAVSFAGWVPIIALVLPNLGEGGTELVVPAVPGAVPGGLQSILLALPTGWGPAAVTAAISSSPVVTVVLPIAGLIAGGAVLRGVWIALTAHTLRRPPARAQSAITVRQPALRRHGGGAVGAVIDRKLKTWFRDPQCRLEMAHAWITPLLMIFLVAPTSWSWALPFIGAMAAVLGAMVAVNTYALDGTALWQLLTTPGAIRADVRGRQIAWLLLFGIPTIALTLFLCAVSHSPLWALALGMTLAATGAACASAPLLSALMPAIGADARERVSTASRTGNAAGGQMTAFAAIALVALLPPVIAHFSGTGHLWPVHIVLGSAFGAAAIIGLTPLTRRFLHRSGPVLLAALTSGDLGRLRTT